MQCTVSERTSLWEGDVIGWIYCHCIGSKYNKSQFSHVPCRSAEKHTQTYELGVSVQGDCLYRALSCRAGLKAFAGGSLELRLPLHHCIY